MTQSIKIPPAEYQIWCCRAQRPQTTATKTDRWKWH